MDYLIYLHLYLHWFFIRHSVPRLFFLPFFGINWWFLFTSLMCFQFILVVNLEVIYTYLHTYDSSTDFESNEYAMEECILPLSSNTRNLKHFPSVGSVYSFCFIPIMHFNFHIVETIQNITIILNSIYLNLPIYLSLIMFWQILHGLPCFYLPFFFFSCVFIWWRMWLIFSFNTLKISIHHLLAFSIVFLQWRFFSVFKIFCLSLVFGNYSKVINAWCYKMNIWV